jgi:hypothetical protein
MSARSLADILANASEAVRRLNLEHYHLPPDPQPEQAVLAGTDGPVYGEKKNPTRILVRSLRRKLIDPDNLCPKYFIDCLRYAGLIPDDTAQDIEISIRQEQVPKGQEQTIIEINQ